MGPVSAALMLATAVWLAAAAWAGCHQSRVAALGVRLRSMRADGPADRFGLTLRWRRAGSALVLIPVVVAALMAVFGVLLDEVSDGEGVTAVDASAWRWVGAHRDVVATTALRAITEVGSAAGLAVLAAVGCGAAAFACRSWRPILLGILGAAILAAVAVVKVVVGRDRPPAAAAMVAEDGYSFPSGHASASTVVVALTAWMLTRWVVRSWGGQVSVWAAAVALVGAIGVSRVYLGVHYPSDVLAGVVLGTAWLLALIGAGTWWERTHPAVARARPASDAPARLDAVDATDVTSHCDG